MQTNWLPDDIWATVLGFLWPNENHFEDLHNCGLVCHKFNSLVQEKVFKIK